MNQKKIYLLFLKKIYREKKQFLGSNFRANQADLNKLKWAKKRLLGLIFAVLMVYGIVY